MSKKLLVFLTGLFLLASLASYVYYRRTVAAVPVDPWELVPDDAVLVAATRDHPTLVRHLKETQVWDNLTAVRYFQGLENTVVLIDSLTGSRNVVMRFLGRKNVLTSVHVTGKGHFDVLLQLPIGSVREYRQVRSLVDALSRDPQFRVRRRDYEGRLLIEISEVGTGRGVTFLNYRNHLVMSPNPGLVEAVVRRLAGPGQPSVAADFQNTDFFRLRDVDATLLVNYRRLPQLLGVFFRPDIVPGIGSVTSLAGNGQLEMKLAGNKVVFNGFANPETAGGSLHERLRGQPARRLRMADVLSLRTALLVHLGIGEARVLRGARPATPADSLSPALAPLLDSLTAGMSAEAALAYMAPASARVSPGRLALVWCARPGQQAVLLGQLRRAVGASPSFERVGAYQMHQMGVPELPARLLGPLFAGFRQPVAAVVGNYVVFGDDAAALRGWLQDVGAGQVWARSPTQVSFLQETQPLARLSVVLDTRNAWNLLLRGLVEERRAGLLRNESLFKRFPQVALQFVPAANEAEAGAQYFTQLLLRHPLVGPAVARPQGSIGTGSVLSFKTPLAGSPTLVSVTGAARPGVLVQDAAQVLHYVTPENVVAWSDTLPGPLVGRVQRQTVGGRLGYLLATATQLHFLDEQGRSTPTFPLNLPDSVRASGLSVSPVGASGVPRLLVAGGGGNLFLYDTKGNTYPNWLPKRLDFNLAAPPLYLVVGGRDVLVVLLENGYVYAFDQQGGVYPGFPISLGARLQSEALAETVGPTLNRTRITVVNQHGERVTFSLAGDVVTRSRVATWSRNSVFRLIPDQRRRSYVVAREEGGQLDLFDPTGRRLLSQKFLTSGQKPVQFFDFGAEQRVYVLTEPGPGKAYVYDRLGRLLGGQPFDSSAPEIGLDYEAATKTYHLYRTTGTELRRTALELK
ncbi:hypothetical protein [Hymenobacter psychrotolerans]|uniref:Outer membrane protein assembly factor BamB, contains PQQ-like beta-propeller repeat n=1 Tax=Hymenobacter psychrotolerans DSM 18569 TaxID=1121959 RepID=A0A1M6T1M6_9BACT|nr:hypothetical protein [Hymenobacter psychrotolerans]SHK50817.1 hypothetical protein SAMN02746009_01049 [Hymenobacter psychrotolerans DSM 18569]